MAHEVHYYQIFAWDGHHFEALLVDGERREYHECSKHHWLLLHLDGFQYAEMILGVVIRLEMLWRYLPMVDVDFLGALENGFLAAVDVYEVLVVENVELLVIVNAEFLMLPHAYHLWPSVDFHHFGLPLFHSPSISARPILLSLSPRSLVAELHISSRPPESPAPYTPDT